MIGPGEIFGSALERLDAHPSVAVSESEYRRLLGYPPDHVPGERVTELAAWARQWYAQKGRPWIYFREATLQMSAYELRLDGIQFDSKQLLEHLRRTGAQRALLVVASAGRECEEQARQLWQEAKPDEYFFLEVFGSAVVEHLVAGLSGQICDLAEKDGLMAVRHYSPGYTGWDVADQNKLFALIARGISQPFPGELEVLSSGMLKPKKSLLAVIGLAPRSAPGSAEAAALPCGHCAFSPCRYRRSPYRYAATGQESVAAAKSGFAGYTVSVRALRKWAQERVRITPLANGLVAVNFRFDGTTCSNQGRPLAFDYAVTLRGPRESYTIVSADCRPVEGDDGYTAMCSYVSDPEGIMQAIAKEIPLLGQPLNEVLSRPHESSPSGCLCSVSQRAHKWRLALEAIHFALAQTVPLSVSPSFAPLP